MTRKKFNGYRLALTLKINEQFKGTEHENKALGQSLKALRGISGKPLVDFGSPYIHGDSYQEVWDSLKDVRKSYGME